MKSSPTGAVPHRLQEAHHLLWRGAVGAGQAGAVDGVDGGALGGGELLDHGRPGGGGAAAAEFGAEQLQQHLGEEVVRVDVGGVDEGADRRRVDHGDRRRRSLRRRCRSRPRARPATPEARSEESSFEAATMAGSAAKLPAAAEL